MPSVLGMNPGADSAVDRQRLADFVGQVVPQCISEPDLDDFFLWWGGTLEYWIHIAASSVGQQARWAARSEIPYITGLPATGAKSNVKWADGAVLWPDGLLVLLEVKSIPMRAPALGSSARLIPRDIAALLSADVSGTIVHDPRPTPTPTRNGGTTATTPHSLGACYRSSSRAHAARGCRRGIRSCARQRPGWRREQATIEPTSLAHSGRRGSRDAATRRPCCIRPQSSRCVLRLGRADSRRHVTRNRARSYEPLDESDLARLDRLADTRLDDFFGQQHSPLPRWRARFAVRRARTGRR